MSDCVANDIVQEIKRIHLEKALNQQDLNLKLKTVWKCSLLIAV